MEERESRVMRSEEGQVSGPSTPDGISTKLDRIAELARTAPTMVLRSLAHHIDVEFLREAYRRTRKDGAVGVDGQTAAEYAENLEANLQDLLNRLKSGAYWAPPVRRTYIPKGGGKSRPLGIPTFEDKVLQRAVAMVLGAVYEQDFLSCSYGFRPGRSAHDALEAIWKGLMDMGGGWVLDVDIQGFFDTLNHGHLRAFLDQRVIDGVVRRSVDKWLKAGVLEDGQLMRPDDGTPQGGVISPLLANVYLHEVLDKWFERDVKPRLRGRSFLVRYADDFVLVFEREDDANRVLAVLPKRFGRYGLTLHPEKTRMVAFRRPSRGGGGPRPDTFDFLGFTHHWAQSRKGRLVVKRRTARNRFARALRAIKEWCARHRHDPVPVQREQLIAKLLGHARYYGVTGNSKALRRFRDAAVRVWRRALARRNREGLPWKRFVGILGRGFPRLTVVPSRPGRLSAKLVT